MNTIFRGKYSHAVLGLCGLFGILAMALFFGGSHVYAGTGIGTGGDGGGGGGGAYAWKVAGDGVAGHAWNSYYRSPPCGISCTPKFAPGGVWNNILSTCQSSAYIWYKVNSGGGGDGYMVSNGFQQNPQSEADSIGGLTAPSAAGQLSYGYYRDGIARPAVIASNNSYVYIVCSSLPVGLPVLTLSCNSDGTGRIVANVPSIGATYGRIRVSGNGTWAGSDQRADTAVHNNLVWTVPASVASSTWTASIYVSYYGTNYFSNIPLRSSSKSPCFVPKPAGTLNTACKFEDGAYKYYFDASNVGYTAAGGGVSGNPAVRLNGDGTGTGNGPTYGSASTANTVNPSTANPDWTFARTSIPAGDWPIHLMVANSSGTYVSVDTVGAANTNLDCPPAGNMDVSCVQNTGFTLSGINDPDAPAATQTSGTYRIEVSQGGPIGTAGSKHVFSGYTDHGSLTIPWVSSSNDPDIAGGHHSLNPRDPRPIETGTYPDWNDTIVWIYVVDITPTGADAGLAGEAQAFDGLTSPPNPDTSGTLHHDKPGPCATVSCVNPAADGVVFAGPLVAGVPNKATVSVAVDNALTPAPAGSGPFRLKINGATSTPAYDISASSGTRLYSASTDFTPALGDVNIAWDWSGPGSNTTQPYQCSTTSPAFKAPYFTVSGGDISAGLPFKASDDSCDQSDATVGALATTSAIKSWNLDNAGGTAGYNGAGTDYAALALGPLRSFITNNALRTGMDAANGVGGAFKPIDLAYANDASSAPATAPIDIAHGKYGGGVGKLGCMTDQFDTLWAKRTGVISAPSGTINTGNVSDETKTDYYDGDLNLTGGNVSGGHGRVIVVNGSVFLNSDITYSYGSLSEVPNVTIVAKNGIYLSGDVHELHGNYVATGAGSKPFATCAVIDASNNFTESTDDAVDHCNSKLDIYGSVSAKTVRLDRTIGSIGDSDGPAETFHYSPETWITQVAGPACTVSCPYNNIAGLPPVL